MASRQTRMRLDVHQLARTCESGKVAYGTRALALDGAERGMDAGAVQPGCHLTPYRCDRCPGWHVYSRQVVRADPHDAATSRHRGGRP